MNPNTLFLLMALPVIILSALLVIELSKAQEITLREYPFHTPGCEDLEFPAVDRKWLRQSLRNARETDRRLRRRVR